MSAGEFKKKLTGTHKSYFFHLKKALRMVAYFGVFNTTDTSGNFPI